MALLISIIIVVAVVAAVLGIQLTGSSDKREQIVRRLRESTPVAKSLEAHASAELLRDEGLSTLPWLDRALSNWSKISYVRALLAQAGVSTKPGQIILSTGVFGLGTYLVAHLLLGNPVLPVLYGLIAGSIPIGTVYFKRYKRLGAFEKNFPDAIDLLARAVRAGHALNSGMEIVGEEMSEPIAGEFRKTFEEQRLGLMFKEALVNLCERVPTQDVRFFATALIIQDETGGNLAEILGSLSATIRDRFRIRGEVRARTAQGRLTAGLLISIPPAMLIALNIINPEYIRPLFTNMTGILMLVGAGTLQFLGGIILWKIVNIDV
ncbi:MAG: type II secretion system F family protein [Acidobacteriia bacterium]|nr:type II secretion system F family protein [Terriglobia bacterium]